MLAEIIIDRKVPMGHPNPEIDFGRSVFVCSKPLQVLNCASIARQFGICESRLHVLTSAIDGAEEFARFVADTSYDQVFSTVSWDVDYDAAIEAFTREPYDTLFIEDDRVGRYRIFEPYRTQRMVLFEEGIGTYRSDPDDSLRGLRKLKWKVLAATTGCGWDFGGGRKTDLVLVSRPDVYRRLNPRTAHKAVGFAGLVDELGYEADAWQRCVREQLGGPVGRLGRVALVLATWGRAPDRVLDQALAEADVVFYKAHPHDGLSVVRDGVVCVSGSWIPAEAFVEVLATISDHVTVYHYSSSVAFYLGGLFEGVDYVDLLDSQQLRDVLGAADG